MLDAVVNINVARVEFPDAIVPVQYIGHKLGNNIGKAGGDIVQSGRLAHLAKGDILTIAR